MELSDAMQRQAKALADPSRFKLLRHIAEAAGPVGVAELTELLGFNHNAIRQHLAALTEAGLVAESNEDRKIRGRPRKQYVLRADALHAFGSVSGSYQRLAELLLAVAGGESPYDVGHRYASQAPNGPALPSRNPASDDPPGDGTAVVDGLMRSLSSDGFEPRRSSRDTVELMHCPFADVASKNPEVVCELHRGLIDGYLHGSGADLVGRLTVMDPQTAGCQILVVPEGRAAGA